MVVVLNPQPSLAGYSLGYVACLYALSDLVPLSSMHRNISLLRGHVEIIPDVSSDPPPS